VSNKDPKRRWKVIPKDELDGPLDKAQREASQMRKKNRAAEGKRKAAKKNR
jgi:hypothetical protein